MRNSSNQGFIASIDWTTIGIYLILVIMGWVNIYAAVYDNTLEAGFNFTHRYGMQLIWICISMFFALSIMLLDVKYYHILTYPLYGLSLVLLASVLLIGREVNGAKSWIILGPIAFQPVEFVKFTTSLMLARYMSNYHFSIKSIKSLINVGLILFLPVLIIILQNDTGSAVVYGSFLFVLYREGLNRWIYISTGAIIIIFILSFLLSPLSLVVLTLLLCVLGEGLVNGLWRSKVIYLASIALSTILIYFLVYFLSDSGISLYASLLISIGLSLIGIVAYMYRYKLNNVLIYILLFLGSFIFSNTVDYAFNNILQTHQQKRILDLLGLESDLKGWGYNVNQSKIAIGSGGWNGKGFLNGTQTKYNFVPEQSTDFIFCTVGEEWGFIGSLLVISLFCVLIMRLMRMGERQKEAYGRIYCYCVAGIFLTHLLINIGMTIGLMPVIGIPLMFFSYGGSSFLAFSILFFVAVKFDASQKEMSNF